MKNLKYTPSEDLNWGELKQLIDSTEGITDESKIDHIRIKGSSNTVHVAIDDEGEMIAHD